LLRVCFGQIIAQRRHYARRSSIPRSTAKTKWVHIHRTQHAVVLAGIVGGLVYWVLMRITGVKPLGLDWYAGVPASLLLGGVAAFLAVYLLANSHTSQPAELKHSVAFALVCGIVWSPIIDTAKQTVLSAVAAKNGDAAKNSAQLLGRQ
jgi:hypothetical protein